MTHWITSPQQDTAKLDEALGAVERLEAALSSSHRSSPEWRAVKAALKEKRRMVVSVGIEVLASHYKGQLSGKAVHLLSQVAQALREARFGKTKALAELGFNP